MWLFPKSHMCRFLPKSQSEHGLNMRAKLGSILDTLNFKRLFDLRCPKIIVLECVGILFQSPTTPTKILSNSTILDVITFLRSCSLTRRDAMFHGDLVAPLILRLSFFWESQHVYPRTLAILFSTLGWRNTTLYNVPALKPQRLKTLVIIVALTIQTNLKAKITIP